MKVKVLCPCGAKFEFDVEPLNDRMPVAIACPVCNADATQLANEVIARQSAAAAVAPAPVPTMPAPVMPPQSAPPPPPAPAPTGGLRIAKAAGHAAPAPVAAPAPTSQAPVDDGRVQLCLKHKNEPVVDACVVCGKPLCTKCMEQFGHVCSVFCRQQAEQKRIYIPVYANQKSVVAHASETRSRSIVYAVVGAVAAVLGLWFYYAWFAREPKIVMRISLGSPSESIEQREDRPAQYFKLIGPGELLTVSGGEASLLNVADHKTLWTTPLSGETVSKIKRLRK